MFGAAQSIEIQMYRDTFDFDAITCIISDVSEAVQNRVRFRPWGGAHCETISRSVAETWIIVGSRL